MAQTRKHFEAAIVNVCAAMNCTVTGTDPKETVFARRMAAQTLFNMANDFARENQRFDRTRFNQTAAETIGGKDTFAAMHGCIPFNKADFS